MRIFNKIILLLTAVSLLLYSCILRSQKQPITSSVFKQIVLHNSDGDGLPGFHFTIDSNGQYKHSYKGRNIGVLPDSVLTSLDTLIKSIITDTTIKTNDALCCDCKTLFLKIIRNTDTLLITQYDEAEIGWKIDTKLNQLVSLLSKVP